MASIEQTKADIRSRMVKALAANPRKARAGRTDSDTKRAARDLALTLTLEAAASALADRDARMEAEYRSAFGRMAELGKLATDAKRRIAEYAAVEAAEGVEAREGDSDLHALAVADLANIKAEQAVLFGQPINPAYDLSPTGRFIRSARYHDRQVGMLSITHEDMLQDALELCYRDTRNLVEVTRGWTADGAPDVELWPTIGAVYQNLKRAHHLALDRFRKAKQGLVAQYSLEALRELSEEDVEAMAHYGRVFVDSEDGVLDALMAVGDLVTPDREALNRAVAREAQAKARQVQARLDAAEAATGDTVSKLALELIVAGESIPAVAKELGIAQKTLIANVKALEVSASTFFRNRYAADVLGWAAA